MGPPLQTVGKQEKMWEIITQATNGPNKTWRYDECGEGQEKINQKVKNVTVHASESRCRYYISFPSEDDAETFRQILQEEGKCTPMTFKPQVLGGDIPYKNKPTNVKKASSQWDSYSS